MRRGLLLAMALLLVCGSAAPNAFSAPPDGKTGAAPPFSASGPPTWTDFTLQNLRGVPVSLGQYIGKKPVLLVFWATWCPHCNESVPEINRIHAESGNGKRLQILALDFLESPEKVDSFVRRKQVSYPVLLDRRGKVARTYRVVGIPTYILIDREGRIVYRDHLIPNLSRYLGPSPPS